MTKMMKCDACGAIYSTEFIPSLRVQTIDDEERAVYDHVFGREVKYNSVDLCPRCTDRLYESVDRYVLSKGAEE